MGMCSAPLGCVLTLSVWICWGLSSFHQKDSVEVGEAHSTPSLVGRRTDRTALRRPGEESAGPCVILAILAPSSTIPCSSCALLGFRASTGGGGRCGYLGCVARRVARSRSTHAKDPFSLRESKGGAARRAPSYTILHPHTHTLFTLLTYSHAYTFTPSHAYNLVHAQTGTLCTLPPTHPICTLTTQTLLHRIFLSCPGPSSCVLLFLAVRVLGVTLSCFSPLRDANWRVLLQRGRLPRCSLLRCLTF